MWACERVCVCVSVNICEWLLSVRLSVSVRLSWKTADKRWCCDSHHQSSKTDHPPLGSQLRPAIDQSQMSTDLSRPSMTHDTKRPTRVHIANSSASLSLVHVTWLMVCLDQVTHHHIILSLAFSLSLILVFLMAIYHRHWVERDDGSESKERKRTFQLDFQPLGSVRTLSQWTFHSCVVPYASLSTLPQSKH